MKDQTQKRMLYEAKGVREYLIVNPDTLEVFIYVLTHAKGSDRSALLARLVEPCFEEAIDMIECFTKEQELRHAYDMRENYQRLVNTYIGTGYKKGNGGIVASWQSSGNLA